jgi:poly-gamma-glutamate capsule biosynthesis protein CapA/YwtB (metallophosphatase superfamily)
MGAVRIVAGGDVALGGILTGLSPEDLAKRVQGVVSLFARGDLSVVSLDCAIGEEGAPPHPEEYLVDGPARNLVLLEQLGVGVVSLANNHSTDRGFEALAAGRGELRRRGILAVGAGGDESAARAPAIVEIDDTRVGVLAFASSDPWVGALAATADVGGVARMTGEMTTAVADLALRTDAVVVCLHWGREYVPLPSPENVHLGRALIDAGARLVIGTHPHVVQPVEAYNGGVICYSLGNLLFPDYPEQGLRFSGSGLRSIVATIELQAETASVESLTMVSFDEEGFLSVVPAAQAQATFDDLAQQAASLGTGRHERAWRQAVRRHEMDRLRRILREEVLAAGLWGGTKRLMSLGRKNLVSVGRSLREILLVGKSSRR